MNYIISALFFISVLNTMVIFDFTKNSNFENWQIINDNVMGGMSRSAMSINENGNAVFKGSISLENNGGFCSVRYNPEEIRVTDFKKAAIRIKGDGKRYQFRIKANRNDNHSYIFYFKTTGNWETIEIPLNEMYPVFRGRKLDMPDFSHNSIEEIAFLIGNKKEEAFQLEIDKIELKK